MKIIFLNVWHGKNDNFVDYVSSQVNTTDIFCFQEAFEEMIQKCQPILSDFQLLTRNKEINKKEGYSLATYIRNDIKILNQSVIFPDTKGVGLGLFTEVTMVGHKINLCNFHGIPRPGEKLDTSERIQQSRDLLTFFDQQKGLKIIGGDFNLEPKTKSVKMFEERGYRNLIKEYCVPTTRNELAWNRFPFPRFHSDYVFVGQDVKVKNFTVPKVMVSDHLPMILEADL